MHRSRSLRRLLPYLFITTLLLLFWSMPSHRKEHTKLSIRPPYKLSFSRELLQRALHGEVPAMYQLLIEWDAHAADDRYVKSIALARQILTHSTNPLEQAISITDDLGSTIACQPEAFFLPQTHLAASIMLAVADPIQIVALPRGMRQMNDIYPTETMNLIDLDTDRYSSESIYSKQPVAAFVARYSYPPTLETLKQQGLELVFLDDLSSIEACLSHIRKIGQLTGHPDRGELLAAFTECALAALDNEIALAEKPLPSKTLFLSLNNSWSTHTKRTLTGMLLDRLGCTWPTAEPSGSWSVALDQERIHCYRPELLMVATKERTSTQHVLESLPGIRETPAFEKGNVFFLDENLQNCPCQLIALAYYDLCRALLGGQEAA